MKRMRIFSVVLIGAGGLTPAGTWAQTKTGTTIAPFVTIGSSARIAAMGNAGAAIGEGIQAVHYNPGALGATGETTIQFTHGFWFADIGYDYAAVLFPVGGAGQVMLSVTSLGSGEIDVRTVSQPLGTGERFSVQSTALSAGFGRQITDRFTAGAQLNYITESIWNSSMEVLTVSIGTAYRLSDNGAQLGVSLLNFGTGGRFDGRDLAIQYDQDPDRYGDNSALPAEQFTDEFAVPILFRVGMTYPQRLSDSSVLLLTGEAAHPSDNSESLSLGWEWRWKNSLSLRAGYENLAQKDSETGLTAGVGVRGGLGAKRWFECDYAWASHATLQDVHRLTFVLAP